MTPTLPALSWVPHKEWRGVAIAGLGNSWLRICSLRHWKSGLLVSPGHMLYCPIRLKYTNSKIIKNFKTKIQAWGSILNMVTFAQLQATEAVLIYNKHVSLKNSVDFVAFFNFGLYTFNTESEVMGAFCLVCNHWEGASPLEIYKNNKVN